MIGMAIGELARATGTKAETIRYYERIGLLRQPARTAANYRSYGSDELARLTFIRRARALGFSIDQVRALMSMSDASDQSCDAVDAIAREHLATVEQKLADLTALRRELSSLVDQCVRGSIAECRILEALSPKEGPV